MGPEIYIGDVKQNSTLKIFKEYLTITKDQLIGEKYVGSFNISNE
jgi:hypothetical protein